jgi:hypothetical protein
MTTRSPDELRGVLWRNCMLVARLPAGGVSACCSRAKLALAPGGATERAKAAGSGSVVRGRRPAADQSCAGGALAMT